MPTDTIDPHARAEQLAADRRSMGLTDIGLARTAVISAMSALDMPQTRGAHVLLGEIADLLQTAKSEASR